VPVLVTVLLLLVKALLVFTSFCLRVSFSCRALKVGVLLTKVFVFVIINQTSTTSYAYVLVLTADMLISICRPGREHCSQHRRWQLASARIRRFSVTHAPRTCRRRRLQRWATAL